MIRSLSLMMKPAPVDTILGVEIFPVVHLKKSQEKIYVSLEDLKDDN